MTNEEIARFFNDTRAFTLWLHKMSLAGNRHARVAEVGPREVVVIGKEEL